MVGKNFLNKLILAAIGVLFALTGAVAGERPTVAILLSDSEAAYQMRN